MLVGICPESRYSGVEEFGPRTITRLPTALFLSSKLAVGTGTRTPRLVV